MGIASIDKNTIRKMSEIEAVIYDRFLQKSAPTRRLILYAYILSSIYKDFVIVIINFTSSCLYFFLLILKNIPQTSQSGISI